MPKKSNPALSLGINPMLFKIIIKEEMKKRNWMNKLSGRAMNMMAAMALMVTAATVNQCCMWFLGQDEMPKGSDKLRRF